MNTRNQAVRHFVLLAILVATGAGTVVAQGLPEQKKGLNTDQAKQPDKATAEQPIDRILAAEAAKGNADNEIHNRLAKYTRWLVLVGVVQFVALIGQGVVFFLTLRSMGGTSQRQLRAYLCVPTTLIKFLKPDLPEVHVHIKN